MKDDSTKKERAGGATTGAIPTALEGASTETGEDDLLATVLALRLRTWEKPAKAGQAHRTYHAEAEWTADEYGLWRRVLRRWRKADPGLTEERFLHLVFEQFVRRRRARSEALG